MLNTRSMWLIAGISAVAFSLSCGSDTERGSKGTDAGGSSGGGDQGDAGSQAAEATGDQGGQSSGSGGRQEGGGTSDFAGASGSSASEGNAVFSIGIPLASDPGWSCTIPAHTTVLGTIQPTDTIQGETLVDGKDGAQVECSVSGDGTFNFRGSITLSTGSLLAVSGQVPLGGRGLGTANMYDLQTTISLSADPDSCQILVDRGALTVENGAIWAGFTCPKVWNPGQPGIWCSSSGYFLFKNCNK
jgi:hypothetical protein